MPGPRILPSGAMISQTGGHGDFRLPHEVPRPEGAPLTYSDQVRVTAIADGADEVLRRAREQLMLGATQIKLMAGGGVTSLYDPIDVTQFGPEELRAAVLAAENWGTYVAVHAYTSKAVRMALEAGVRSIEHGQLVDEETVRMMVEKGAMQRWYSPGEVLQIATRNNGQLLALAGPRYPLEGPVGVIEEGAMADLLLVDGDPTQDLSLIGDPEKNFLLIMKDGVVFKNLLP